MTLWGCNINYICVHTCIYNVVFKSYYFLRSSESSGLAFFSLSYIVAVVCSFFITSRQRYHFQSLPEIFVGPLCFSSLLSLCINLQSFCPKIEHLAPSSGKQMQYVIYLNYVQVIQMVHWR